MKKNLCSAFLILLVLGSCSKGGSNDPVPEPLPEEEFQVEATINGIRTKFNLTSGTMGRDQSANHKNLGLIFLSEDKQHSLILIMKNEGVQGNQIEKRKYEVVKLPVDDPATKEDESLNIKDDGIFSYAPRMADDIYLYEPFTTKGEIVVTENDPEKMTVSGTFSCELRVYENQQLKTRFTNGKFRNIKYVN